MDIYEDSILEIWRVFLKNELKYIMVGGFAVNLHGFQRTTGDIDIWIKDDIKNRSIFRNCLKDLGYGDMPEIANIDFVPGWSTFQIKDGIELYVMTYLKGFEQAKFDFCLSVASIAEVFELKIPFLHLNQLIEEKYATGRPKDLIDLIELQKIEKLRETE